MHIHVLQYTVYPVKQSVVVDVKITEVMWIQYKLYWMWTYCKKMVQCEDTKNAQNNEVMCRDSHIFVYLVWYMCRNVKISNMYRYCTSFQ